jgi:superkiller protein 3
MTNPRIRLFLLVATLILWGSQSLLRAQEGFKGERRAPNPTVSLRTGARRPTINEKVEMALAQGNRSRDKANTVGTSDDLDAAEKFYKKALALNPKEARAYVGLGNVEMDYDYVPEADGSSSAWKEGMKRAADYYQKALEINPKYYDAYMGLAWVHQLQSFDDPSIYAKSEQEYRQAMLLRPGDPEPHSSLGSLYERRESDYSKAVAEYREAIKLATDKGDLSALYSRLGDVLEKWGQYAEAVDAYRKRIELDPKNGTAHFDLGRVYLDKLQKYAEAVEELKLAVKLNPNDAPAFPPRLYEAYYKLGLSYVEAKNKTAAMEQYQILRKAGQTAYAERLLAEINKL